MRIYGPVPSRRFGLSLGVDVIPYKTCTFDCIYCQLGPTAHTTDTQRCFFPIEEILCDVAHALERGPAPDVITLAGSGEPTLYGKLGELIDALHALADIPILLITNSSLLYRPEVAAAVSRANILAPSLDAGDEETYRLVNKPHENIPFETVFRGLKEVTHAHLGEVHLEVMIIDRVNDDEKSLRAIADRIKELRFDRIDINTPVRPPMPGRGAIPADETALARAQSLFGPLAHPIGKFEKRSSSVEHCHHLFSDRDKDIREMLLRRPCTLDDLAAALAMGHEETSRSLDRLIASGLVKPIIAEESTYFHAPSANPTLVKRQTER